MSTTETSEEAPSVKVIRKMTPYEGFFRIDHYLVRHRLFSGGWSEVLSRELFDRGRVAAVLPVDLSRNEVVLIEQFRLGAYVAGWGPWLFECVAGVLDPGETAPEVAHRESVEESGCKLTQLYHVMDYLSSPGASSETVALFCGQVDSSRAQGIHGLKSEGEDIKVHVVGLEEASVWLETGRIRNAKTIIVLQWLQLNYERLKRAWNGETD